MVFFKRIRPLICPAILLVLLFISVLVLANVLIQRPSVQKYILNKVSESIDYDILAGEIELNFWRGIGILINDFEAKSRDGGETFTASSVLLILDIGELIKGRLAASSLQLFKPIIQLPLKTGAGQPGGGNIFDIKDISHIPIPDIQSILVEQGTVDFIGSTLSLDDLYFKASRTSPDPLTFMLNANGRMGFRGNEATFELRGIILPASQKGESPFYDIMLKTGKAPLTWIPWPRSVPVEEGDFEAELKIEGNAETGISLSGKIDMESLKFSLHRRERSKDFSIPEISFDLRSLIKDRSISFDSLLMHNHDFSIDLKLLVDMKEGERPYIDLSAASEVMPLQTLKMLFPSPILPAWIEKYLFPILSNGDVKLTSLKLTGNTETIKKLKLPENRGALELDFDCRNFEVSGNGIQLPFNNVSAEISLREGDFYVSGLKGDFGGSVINEAGLNVKRTPGFPTDFRILMDGFFNLRELIGQRQMEVIPEKARLWLDRFKELEGRMECKTEIGYEKGSWFPEILSGEFFFSDCLFNSKETLLPLTFKKAEIFIHETDENRLNGTGTWGNTPFNLTGDFGLTGKDFDFQKVNISADADMNQVISSVSEWVKTPFKFIGTVPWNVLMTKENGYYSWRGEVDLKGLVLESENLSVGPWGRGDSIRFDLETRPDNRIDLKKIYLNIKNSSINISGGYDLGNKHLYRLYAASSGLSIKDLGIFLKKSKVNVGGILSGTLNISFPERSIRSCTMDGAIEGREMSFPGIFPSPVSDCSFDLDFSGKKLTVNSWDIKAGQSGLRISGELNGWDNLEGNLLINSDYLDLADVLSSENLFNLKERSDRETVFNDLEIGIDLDIGGGIWKKIKYDRINAEMVLRREGLYINSADIDLENGGLKINGHMTGGDNTDISLSGDIQLADQPIYELFESLGIGDGRFIGGLDMEAQLSMKGKEKKDLLPNLSGSGKISISEGLIKRSRVFLKMLDVLSLENIYKQRSEELKEDGFYFESMNADFVIDQGIVSSEDFEMKSPAFNAHAYGKIDIPEKGFDFILGAQPHGTIDSLVSNIPILGYIITGEKKSVMVYPFEVKGPILSPKVTFIPLESLSENVGGVLKRLFLTPMRLLNGLGKANGNQKEKEFSGDNQ